MQMALTWETSRVTILRSVNKIHIKQLLSKVKCQTWQTVKMNIDFFSSQSYHLFSIFNDNSQNNDRMSRHFTHNLIKYRHLLRNFRREIWTSPKSDISYIKKCYRKRNCMSSKNAIPSTENELFKLPLSFSV